jgi:hypothetical protein
MLRSFSRDIEFNSKSMYINKKNQHVIELGYILMTQMSYHQVCHIITSQFFVFSVLSQKGLLSL